jgi:hypothetical protein
MNNPNATQTVNGYAETPDQVAFINAQHGGGASAPNPYAGSAAYGQLHAAMAAAQNKWNNPGAGGGGPAAWGGNPNGMGLGGVMGGSPNWQPPQPQQPTGGIPSTGGNPGGWGQPVGNMNPGAWGGVSGGGMAGMGNMNPANWGGQSGAQFGGQSGGLSNGQSFLNMPMQNSGGPTWAPGNTMQPNSQGQSLASMLGTKPY